MKTLTLNTLIAVVLSAWLPLAANALEATDSAAPAPRAVSEALSPEAAQSLESAKAAFDAQQRQLLSLPLEPIALPATTAQVGVRAAPRIAQTTRPILIAASVQASL